jgi:hypothetical protein
MNNSVQYTSFQNSVRSSVQEEGFLRPSKRRKETEEKINRQTIKMRPRSETDLEEIPTDLPQKKARSVTPQVVTDVLDKLGKGEINEDEQSDSVKVKTMEKFFNKLSSFSNDHFPSRMQALLGFFTLVFDPKSQKKNLYRLWLEVPENYLLKGQEGFYLNCMIFQDSYFSNAVAEGEMGERKVGSSYTFFKVFEDEALECPVLQIRWDEGGKLGEIIHIKKGKNFKGKQIKKFCMTLLNFLKIEKVYLNDDAWFSFGSYFQLRMGDYLPIVSNGAWYSDEFEPLECKNILGYDGKTYLTQNPSTYHEAIKRIRNMPISLIITYLTGQKKCTKQIKSIESLVANYIVLDDASNIITVHQLGKAIFDSLTTSKFKNKNQEYRAMQNFLAFRTIVLNPIPQGNSSSQTIIEYNQALNCYLSVSLWHKDWVSPASR